MKYQLDRDKQEIVIHGKTFSKEDFKEKRSSEFFSSEALTDVYDFLHEWFDDNDFVWVKTSGSTGKPKPFQAEKQRMMQSAAMTCSFLGLEKGDKALLCMKMGYIAGKMMVVRALIAALDLVVIPVDGNPLRHINQHIDFAAFVPLQIYNSLQNEDEKQKLASIKQVIIGGGTVDQNTEIALKTFPNSIYSTYGMTETLSHIAMRKLSGTEASDYYTLLKDVKATVSKRGTLTIDAPLVAESVLETNDLVEFLPTNQFKVIGRIDNVINSGGLKIQIEEIENMLYPHLGDTFAITSMPDAKFGEIVVLVTTQQIDKAVLEELPHYYRPKKIVLVETIPLTETGKIDRKKLKEIESIK